ncbi:uncharacterized protein METZ01_LOCUS465374, partial [marine metagenome]
VITDAFRVVAVELDLAGKRVLKSNIISEDGLSQTVVTIFDSEASRFDFVENSTIQSALNVRDMYCIENDISISQSSEDI